MFQLHQTYSRDEIHDALGGSKEYYLPHVGGSVVCACLRLDTNPDAPSIILPGTGKRIEGAAEMLIAQTSAIPVFLKRASNQWEYVGEYAVERCSRDPGEIRRQSQRSKRDTDVTSVIYMRRVRT